MAGEDGCLDRWHQPRWCQLLLPCWSAGHNPALTKSGRSALIEVLVTVLSPAPMDVRVEALPIGAPSVWLGYTPTRHNLAASSTARPTNRQSRCWRGSAENGVIFCGSGDERHRTKQSLAVPRYRPVASCPTLRVDPRAEAHLVRVPGLSGPTALANAPGQGGSQAVYPLGVVSWTMDPAVLGEDPRLSNQGINTIRGDPRRRADAAPRCRRPSTRVHRHHRSAPVKPPALAAGR